MRLLAALVVAGLLVGFGVHAITSPGPFAAAAAPLAGTAPLHGFAAPVGSPGPGGDPNRSTLVLYDDSGNDWQTQQSYGIQAANLLTRGGRVDLRPVASYRCGETAHFSALVFVGSGSGNPLPNCLLTDALSGRTPTMWMGQGIEAAFQDDPVLAGTLGWRFADGPGDYPLAVTYKGRRLDRTPRPDDPVNRVVLDAGSPAQVLAWGIDAAGHRSPWAVRTGKFTYVAEVPFDYVSYGGRYLAAADLLRALALPEVPDRHRVLVRLEDVGPKADPAQLRAIADYLHGAHVPFTVAVYPVYVDVTGHYDHGRPTTLRLADRPDVVAALKYMSAHGGTLELHGYTHQYGDTLNPSGVSGDDYEFYRVHVDRQGAVRTDGPVPNDSKTWAASRMQRGRAEMTRVGLPDPGIFEFPHYTAAAPDYRAATDIFGVRYEEGTYFSSRCRPGHGPCDHEADPATLFQQYFPYPVRDVYGSVVIPENVGYVAPHPIHGEAHETAADVVDNARKMLVVRDGVASFFYHPYLGVSRLREVVTGIQNLGYHFVSPTSLLRNG